MRISPRVCGIPRGLHNSPEGIRNTPLGFTHTMGGVRITQHPLRITLRPLHNSEIEWFRSGFHMVRGIAFKNHFNKLLTQDAIGQLAWL